MKKQIKQKITKKCALLKMCSTFKGRSRGYSGAVTPLFGCAVHVPTEHVCTAKRQCGPIPGSTTGYHSTFANLKVLDLGNPYK